jgi:hypothetical protein
VGCGSPEAPTAEGLALDSLRKCQAVRVFGGGGAVVHWLVGALGSTAAATTDMWLDFGLSTVLGLNRAACSETAAVQAMLVVMGCADMHCSCNMLVRATLDHTRAVVLAVSDMWADIHVATDLRAAGVVVLYAVAACHTGAWAQHYTTCSGCLG